MTSLFLQKRDIQMEPVKSPAVLPGKKCKRTHCLTHPANAPHKGSEVSTLNIVNKIIFKTLRKEFAPVADSMRDSTSWTLSSGIIITSSSENLFLGKELQQTDFGELCCPDARTVLSKGPRMAVKKKSLHCFGPCSKKNDYKQAHSDVMCHIYQALSYAFWHQVPKA